jgi:hypothetical protein
MKGAMKRMEERIFAVVVCCGVGGLIDWVIDC